MIAASTTLQAEAGQELRRTLPIRFARRQNYRTNPRILAILSKGSHSTERPKPWPNWGEANRAVADTHVSDDVSVDTTNPGLNLIQADTVTVPTAWRAHQDVQHE